MLFCLSTTKIAAFSFISDSVLYLKARFVKVVTCPYNVLNATISMQKYVAVNVKSVCSVTWQATHWCVRSL